MCVYIGKKKHWFQSMFIIIMAEGQYGPVHIGCLAGAWLVLPKII